MRLSPPFTKCLVVFLVCVLSFAVIYFFGSEMLFDRFIYQKSGAYGYWSENTTRLKDFGERTKDLVSLMDYLYSSPQLALRENAQTENILGATTNDTYTIFVIGDSYVFGQGIRTEQRFSNVLEKKLNTMKKTRVIVLGGPGDNFFDNYIKYLAARQRFGIPNTAGQLVNDSLSKDTKNFCAFKNLLKYLPKDNTLYLSMDSLEWPSTPMQTNLIDKGFAVFFFDDYYKKHKGDYFFNTLFKKDPFSVSKTEPHPSVLANKIFADSVFEEITTNQKWSFR